MRPGYHIVICLLTLCLSLSLFPLPSVAQRIPEEALILKEDGDRAMMRGDIEQAVRAYEKALRIYPDLPDVIYFLGLTYDLDFEDLDNAVYYYRRYLELTPQGGQSREVLNRLKKAEKRLEDRKKALGLIEEPPAIEPEKRRDAAERPPEKIPSEAITTQAPQAPSPSADRTDTITFQMQESILKYDIKLGVWEREGFVKRFNELAQKRISPLEEDIATQRENLRMERARITEFINYQEEAIDILLEIAVLRGISTLGIQLDHYPEGFETAPYISSYDINDVRENARFVILAAEVHIDLKALAEGLSANGFLFEPNRMTLILQNIQGDALERFIDHIVRHSRFTGPPQGGLIPVYTIPETFAKEISAMRIGRYQFQPVSVGGNQMTIQVLLQSE